MASHNPLPVAELSRAGYVPGLDSIIELALVVPVQVSHARGHESGRAHPAPYWLWHLGKFASQCCRAGPSDVSMGELVGWPTQLLLQLRSRTLGWPARMPTPSMNYWGM